MEHSNLLWGNYDMLDGVVLYVAAYWTSMVHRLLFLGTWRGRRAT
jgi:hypothetical protein